MSITVSKLKEKLQEAIDKLNEYPDNEELSTSCNTYCMSGWVLGIPSVGFINILDIRSVKEAERDSDLDSDDYC